MCAISWISCGQSDLCFEDVLYIYLYKTCVFSCKKINVRSSDGPSSVCRVYSNQRFLENPRSSEISESMLFGNFETMWKNAARINAFRKNQELSALLWFMCVKKYTAAIIKYLSESTLFGNFVTASKKMLSMNACRVVLEIQCLFLVWQTLEKPTIFRDQCFSRELRSRQRSYENFMWLSMYACVELFWKLIFLVW